MTNNAKLSLICSIKAALGLEPLGNKVTTKKHFASFKDPETMHEEIQQLKMSVNNLQQDKRILTGKLHMFEREKGRLERRYEDLVASNVCMFLKVGHY
jgi:hypothetical protein